MTLGGVEKDRSEGMTRKERKERRLITKRTTRVTVRRDRLRGKLQMQSTFFVRVRDLNGSIVPAR